MAAVWCDSGLDKGLTALSPTSGAISHISKLSAGKSFSVISSAPSVLGVLWFKGGTGGSAGFFFSMDGADS